MTVTVLQGEAREVLATLPAELVHCVITSPPYWNLRQYSNDPREIGHEETVAEYVATLVNVFAAVHRLLRQDGTCWINLGDSYAHDDKWGGATGGKHARALHGQTGIGRVRTRSGLKPKDLCLIPHRVAIALQDWGWWVRSDIVWSKPNAMPSSVRDRPAVAHEYVFLLSKSARYFYDAEAVKQPATGTAHSRGSGVNPKALRSPSGWDTAPGAHTKLEGRYPRSKQNPSFSAAIHEVVESRNLRTVWEIPTQPYVSGHDDIDHFATFPEALVERCLLAGTSAYGCCATCRAPYRRQMETSRERDPRTGKNFMRGAGHERTGPGGPANRDGRVFLRITTSATAGWQPTCSCPAGDPVPCVVLDPFCGSGTVLAVAQHLGRDAIGIDLNPDYMPLIEDRVTNAQPPLFGIG